MPNKARSRTAKKKQSSIPTQPETLQPEEEAEPSPYPALRSALWLYLLVLLGTFAIVVVFVSSIDPVFLRLVAALFVAGGFTAAALFITDVRPGPIFGNRPTVNNMIPAFFAGLAIWMPVLWVFTILNGLLNTYIGGLPLPIESGATPVAIALQSGIFIPLCQGLLFWAYFQRAAEGIGFFKGALLTAALFALFALFSTEFGVSGIPAMFLAGLVAVLAVYFTGSAWTGIAVASGYGMARLALENSVLDWANIKLPDGRVDPNALFGGRWLVVLAVSLFIAFITIRIIAATTTNVERNRTPRAPIRRLWWVPLVLSVILVVLIGYGEVLTRLHHPLGAFVAPATITPTPTPNGSTGLPVPPTPTPIPSQTPQPTNK